MIIDSLNQKNISLYKLSLFIGLQLILIPTLIFISSVTLFWLQVPIFPTILYILILALAFYLLKYIFLIHYIAFFFTLMIVSFSLILSNQLYDFSWDGQWYHQPAIMALASGWNPFSHHFLSDWNSNFAENITSEIYINHYAKSSWIIQSIIFKVTNSFESAKALSLLYAFATFFISFSFLIKIESIKIFTKVLIATFITLNPVFICQISTFYVDGQMFFLIAILIISLSAIVIYEDNRFIIPLFASSILLINIKFTGLVYTASFFFIGLTFLIYLKRKTTKNFLFLSILVMLFGTLYLGYQPYITNIIYEKNPFYPAIKNDGSTILDMQASKDFLQKNRLEKLFLSTFSKSQTTIPDIPELKIPFTIQKQELWTYTNGDSVRVGGFGPLFGSILLMLLITLITLVIINYEFSIEKIRAICFILILISCSSLLNPEAWWARHTPQIWLIVIVLLGTLVSESRKIPVFIGKISIIIIAINILIVSAYNIPNEFEKTAQYHNQMRMLKNMSKNRQLEIIFTENNKAVDKRRLEFFGVKFRESSNIDCVNPMLIGFPESRKMQVCLTKDQP